ncbi:MAG TPA: MucR family transcriptional regulator [Azospirillum sp.]|nr:MucR family transcriptional regulator [Azospirillum sp.]
MDNDLQRLTTTIVSAYAANNSVARNDLPTLIQNVFSALDRLGKAPIEVVPAEAQKPAVPIRRSVTPDYIVCLECGKTQKTLRRHLGSAHALTPQEYRAKWNLPREYPLTAPRYAEARSQMAKATGLGKKPRQRRGQKRK